MNGTIQKFAPVLLLGMCGLLTLLLIAFFVWLGVLLIDLVY